jgi:hypothetical protein
MEFWFDDFRYGPSGGAVNSLRSNMRRKLRIVRNCMQCPALPKRLVCLGEEGLINTSEAYTSSGATDGKRYRVAGGTLTHARATGYARLGTGDTLGLPIRPYPVDEFLPSSGAPDGALFYVVVEGPAIVTTQVTAGASGEDIAVNDLLYAASTVTTVAATTSSSTSGGRVSFTQKISVTAQGLTGSSTADAHQLAALWSVWGSALSTAASTQSTAELLVKVLPRRF